MLKIRGFTIVEILIAVVVIALLASVGMISYRTVQERAARASVLSTLNQGSETLEVRFVRKNDYPPNFAGTSFVPSEGVVTALWTNAPVVRTYSPGYLNDDENTQLFLNTCNANVPLVVGGKTYFTSCSFAGNSVNIHVKGQAGSNALIQGPTISRDTAETEMKCGIPECADVAQLIFDQFEEQGGAWPLESSGTIVPLPDPDVVTATGPATRFCFEARSEKYPEIVAHTMSGVRDPQAAPCPEDPELHYP